MAKTKRLVLTASLLIAVAGLMVAQQTGQSYSIALTGANGSSVMLTPEALHKLPQQTVTAKNEHDQTAHTYTGVYLQDVLKLAGAPAGHDLRGTAMRGYVLIEASDGYGVVFSLAELDPSINSKVVMLADTMDGKALASDQGPLKIIVPDEKRPARWIRQVARITLGTVAVQPKK